MKKYALLGCALILLVQAVASESENEIEKKQEDTTGNADPAPKHDEESNKNDARWLHNFAHKHYPSHQGPHWFPADPNWRPDSFYSSESDSSSFSSDYGSSDEYSDTSYDESDSSHVDSHSSDGDSHSSDGDSHSSHSSDSHSSDGHGHHHYHRRTTRRPRTTTRRQRTTTTMPTTTTATTPKTTASTSRKPRTTTRRPTRRTTRYPPKDDSSSSSSSSSSEEDDSHKVCVKHPPVIVRRDPDPERLPIMMTRQQMRICGMRRHPCTCTRYGYRTYDGTCNNLRNPDVGVNNIPLSRLVAARYCDGLSTQRRSVKNGRKLPSSRKVTKSLFNSESRRRPHITQMVIAFWIFVAEDIFQLKRRTDDDSHKCCTAHGKMIPRKFRPPSCLPIKVPKNDSFFNQFDQECIHYERIGIAQECREDEHRPIEQVNLVPSYLDLSQLYGSRPKEVKLLRKFKKGQLKTKYVRRQHHPKAYRQFLPNVHDARVVCGAPAKNDPCYLSPNTQVNKLITLAALQTIFVRQHNRIARRLHKRYPTWEDEDLFQQARKILTGIYHNIIYNHWLPLLIGKEALTRWKLPFFRLSASYDANINPGAISDMVSAGFSTSNTLLTQEIELMDKNRHVIKKLDLIASIGDPSMLEKAKNFDAVLRGAVTQRTEAFDNSFIKEMLELELGIGNMKTKGVDLIAIDIQNGRDLGISTYNDARRLCNKKRAKEFHEFEDTIKSSAIAHLKNLYHSPDDVDLVPALYLEKPYDGGLVGEIASCLFAEQFARLRQGDRFFTNAEGFKHSFSKEQLNAILPVTLSSLICASSDSISRIQPNAFVQPSPGNPLRRCKTIPRLDLDPWKNSKLPEKTCATQG
nr:nymph-specific protein N2 [Ischnura senegalensis]